MLAVWGFAEGLLVEPRLREHSTHRSWLWGSWDQASVQGEGGLNAASSPLALRKEPVLRTHALRSYLSWKSQEVECTPLPLLMSQLSPGSLSLLCFFQTPSSLTLLRPH